MTSRGLLFRVFRILLFVCELSGANDHGNHMPESKSRISDERIHLQIDEVPSRPSRFELGDPFLGAGPISQGIALPTGAVWNPSLLVFGNLRTAVQHTNDGENTLTEWANRLDVFANLQLTATERVLIGFRPLDDGRRFAGYTFEPEAEEGFEESFDANLEAFFFEGDFGELFPFLDPEDGSALDWGFAVGRQPFLVQEGLLADDALDSIGIVRNTLRPFGTSNLRLTGVVAWNDIHRNDHREDESALLFALLSEMDLRSTTVAVDFLGVEADRATGDALYLGGGAARRLGPLNAAFRVNASIPLDGDTAATSGGVLQFAELSWTPQGSEDLVYLNAFWAIDEFSSAARAPDAGGPLARAGILYEAVGLGRYGSALDSGAEDVVGGALGYQRFLGSPRRQLVIEVGGRLDTDGRDDAAAALGARFQHAWGKHVLLEPSFFAGVQEDGDEFLGLRFEFRIKF